MLTPYLLCTLYVGLWSKHTVTSPPFVSLQVPLTAPVTFSKAAKTLHGAVSFFIAIENLHRQGKYADIMRMTSSRAGAFLDNMQSKGYQFSQYVSDPLKMRFRKWLSLMDWFNAFNDHEGDTAMHLRKQVDGVGVAVGVAAGAGAGAATAPKPTAGTAHSLLHERVTQNAVQVLKVGIMGKDGIDNLLRQEGVKQDMFEGSPSSTSSICRSTPHAFCDAIQSLDEPSTYVSAIGLVHSSTKP